MRTSMIVALALIAGCGTVTTEGRDAAPLVDGAVERDADDPIIAADAPPFDAESFVRVACFCTSTGTETPAYCVRGTCADMTPTCTEQCGGTGGYPISCDVDC